MTALGYSRNDAYRLATQQIVPAPMTKRVKCSQCRRTQSIGQYGQGSDICITCKPQGKNFRRGL